MVATVARNAKRGDLPAPATRIAVSVTPNTTHALGALAWVPRPFARSNENANVRYPLLTGLRASIVTSIEDADAVKPLPQ